MTLEDLVREAHRTGRLADLSVRRAGRGFQANYKPSADRGHKVAIHEDPVEALKEVLTPFKPEYETETEDIEGLLS